jgi:hypothetical protein
MLQHFVEMADSGKMDGPTLKSGTKALVNYMQERAMESKGGNQPAQGGGITVTAPNGKVYPFKDQASADAFKKEAGIK